MKIVPRFWIGSLKTPKNISFAAAPTLLFLTTGHAWAQDYSDQMPGMDALAGPGPDYGEWQAPDR
jgi:hypothetical protein